MFDSTRLALFLSAAFLLAVTPGPGILYVLTRSLAGGRREGVLSAAGTFLGGLVHVNAAALGLSALLVASSLAFNVVRFAGAAYLIYLGIGMLRRRNEELDPPKALPTVRRDPFVQGIFTEILNPKTALFFLSFIPQFVSVPRGHVVLQFLILGSISVTLNTLADLVVALFAGPLGARLKQSAVLRKRQRAASGAIMIGLGLYVAAADSK